VFLIVALSAQGDEVIRGTVRWVAVPMMNLETMDFRVAATALGTLVVLPVTVAPIPVFVSASRYP
jgi:hypothetical protein